MQKIVVLVVLVFCVGCGQPYNVNIDSISSGESLSGSKCAIVPYDPNIISDQLQYKEYTAYIKRALEKNGYEVTDDISGAKVAVIVRYGISEPQESFSSYTRGKFDNNGHYSAETTHPITYTRFLILDAYDLEKYRSTNKQIQLWKITAVSTGSSGDLRFVFPVIVAATTDYIGVNTGKQISMVIYENDKRIQEIKGLSQK